MAEFKLGKGSASMILVYRATHGSATAKICSLFFPFNATFLSHRMHLASLEFYYVSLKDEYRKRLWYCSASQIHVVDAQTVNLEEV